MLRNNGQCLDLRAALELVTQGLGQVAHGVEIAGTALMNPTKQLGGAEALFPQPLAKRRQTVEVEFQQIRRAHGAKSTGDQA